ncbi:MAG: hypoxanthine phosphoribosyltransferase [Daejeonella sp.]
MKIQVNNKEFDLLLEYEQIQKRIRLLGIQLSTDYENRTPVFIGVLNGSFMFLADLLKEITIPCEISFVKVSSYDGDKSTPLIKQEIGISMDLKDRDVIIVEDIVDTGNTLNYLLAMVKKHQPTSINVCTLLFKPKAVKQLIPEIAYAGFEIPNEFVVGYGLDYNGLGRNLKNIYRAV